MALFTHWYDLLSLAIIVAAAIASLWGLKAASCDQSCSKRRGGVDGQDKCQSLLASGDGTGDGTDDEEAAARPPPSICGGGVWSRQLWMSQWRAVHPAALLLLRLLAAAAMSGVLLWDLWTYDWSIMLYYTEWTFSLVIIYFLIASVMSAHGCWIYYSKCASQNDEENAFLKRDVAEHAPATLTGTNRSKKASKLHSFYEQGDYDQKAGFWGYLMQIAYQTSAGAVVLTDIVFWGLLVPFLSVQHFKLDLLMGCMHTLNLLFLLVDTALNSLPFPWFRMAYFVLWSCIYVFFQWILHVCGFSWWPYPFLELQTPWAPLWYFGLALIHIPCYGLYKVIVAAKTSFFPRIFRHVYERP